MIQCKNVLKIAKHKKTIIYYITNLELVNKKLS